MRALRLTLVFTFLIIVLLAAACAPALTGTPAGPGSPTVDIGKIVEQTLAALTALPTATQPSATPASPTSSAPGSISGRLNYPADSLPAMYVVAYHVGSQTYRYVITKAGQGTYTIDNLPPGTYNVIAYTVGGGSFPAGFAGGYTQAVICGLAPECADHSLVDVQVAAGEDVKDANVLDWYAPAGTFRPFPGQVGAPTTGPGNEPGGIAGVLTYPADKLPPMRIVAFRVGSESYYYVEEDGGPNSYQINGLPPGTYHVVAYVLPGNGFPDGMMGGYTQAVRCGLQTGCDDHTLIDVQVQPGQVTTDVNPSDFFAPQGSFPADPVP